MEKADTRQGLFDSIRNVLTALVIVHHSAIVYGGAGGWYWREQVSSSNSTLVALNAVNQSFFMGFFFLISGYFSASTIERRGTREFMLGRLLRLGLPLAVYFFVISPLTVSLASMANGEPFGATFQALLMSAQFEPGPLWFVQSLLLLSACYVVWLSLFKQTPRIVSLPNIPKLAAAGIIIGIISFIVRLWLPVGQSFLWLQLGYFPLYIFLFVAGCLSYHARILERITLKQAVPWMVLSAFSVGSLPFVMGGALGSGAFEGGYSLNAMYYAIWDPAVAFGVILGMLWLFRNLFSEAGSITAFLSRRAYAVYIVHPPVLVAFSIFLSGWVAHPVLKTGVLAFLTWLGCIAVASLVLSFAPVRRVI